MWILRWKTSWNRHCGDDMKIHMNRNNEKTLCGKRLVPPTMANINFQAVTCLTCIEVYKNDRGLLDEYKLGGDFNRFGKRRKYKEHWSYREQMAFITKRIKAITSDLEHSYNYSVGESELQASISLAVDALKELLNEKEK